MHVKGIIWRVFLKQKGKWLFKKTLKKVKVKKKWVQEEWDQENKKKRWKQKEKLDERKHKNVFSKEIQFWKIRKRQRKIKKEKLNFSTFFERRNEKRDPSRKKKTLFLSECKDYFLKKHLEKMIVKH